jgi:hypothetical protein
MARRDKLLERFRQQPADFTWDELVRLLRSFDYEVAAKGRIPCASSGAAIRRSTCTDRTRARTFDVISCASYARS